MARVRWRSFWRSLTTAVLTRLHGSRDSFVRDSLDDHEVRQILILHRVRYVEQPHVVVPDTALLQMRDDAFQPQRARVAETCGCGVDHLSIRISLGRVPRRKTG